MTGCPDEFVYDKPQRTKAPFAMNCCRNMPPPVLLLLCPKPRQTYRDWQSMRADESWQWMIAGSTDSLAAAVAFVMLVRVTPQRTATLKINIYY